MKKKYEALTSTLGPNAAQAMDRLGQVILKDYSDECKKESRFAWCSVHFMRIRAKGRFRR